eukprot:SAG31_NODE_21839_length_539_cov_1.418182_1_plen_23_part_01
MRVQRGQLLETIFNAGCTVTSEF